MSPKDWTDIAATVLQAVSIAATAVFAARGLNAWRHQLLGKRRIEVAEEVLGSTYVVRANLVSVRNPMVFGNEGTSRPTKQGEPDAHTSTRNMYFVPLERIQKLDEDLTRFAKAKALAWVHLGPEAAKPFDEVTGVYYKIAVAARMLVTTSDELGSVAPKLRGQWEATIWQTEATDEITTAVALAVKDIEAQCRPFLA